jgi:hypothetical protein
MPDGFTISDVEQLELEHHAEEAAKHYAREFIDDLLDDAGHTLRLRPGDYEAVIRECAVTLSDAGFDPRPEEFDGEPVAWAFAGTATYYDLETEVSGACRLVETPPVTVAGYLPVYHDPMLDERTVVLIHRDAIVPTPPGAIEKPWLVEHPDGVVVAEVETDG